MNQSRQRVTDQCRKHGLCVLSREEFEAAFLFDFGPSESNLTEFCLAFDLELVVDAEAGQFFFLRGQPEPTDSWCSPAKRGFQQP